MPSYYYLDSSNSRRNRRLGISYVDGKDEEEEVAPQSTVLTSDPNDGSYHQHLVYTE
jgi:hypothetical protein